MKKKLTTLAVTLSMIIGFSTNSYAVETNKIDYKISETSLDYTPDPNSPFMNNNRKEIYNKMVDPGKAMGLSALYFGLGQLYSGDTQKGALILAGGTLLTATIFLVALPNLAKRQESVAGTGTALSLIALGTAYVFNIRDAYTTAEKVNDELKNQLLTQNNYLYELEKINISSKNSTIGLTYNFKF